MTDTTQMRETSAFALRLARYAARHTRVLLSNGEEEVETDLAEAVTSHYEALFEATWKDAPDSPTHEQLCQEGCKALVRDMAAAFETALLAELRDTGTVR